MIVNKKENSTFKRKKSSIHLTAFTSFFVEDFRMSSVNEFKGEPD